MSSFRKWWDSEKVFLFREDLMVFLLWLLLLILVASVGFLFSEFRELRARIQGIESNGELLELQRVIPVKGTQQ